MKEKITLGARIILGLIFVVFGLNYFFPFIPLPHDAGPAGNFMDALLATGYFYPTMKVIEISSGLMLLSGIFVPLALLLLAPIILEISFFHIFLAPSGIPMVIILLALELTLAWAHKETYAPIFSHPAPKA